MTGPAPVRRESANGRQAWPSYNSPPQPRPSYDVAQASGHFLLRQRPSAPGVSRAPGAGTAKDGPRRGKSHAIAADKHHDVDTAVGEESALVLRAHPRLPRPRAPGPGLLNQRIGSRIRPLVLSTDASHPVKPFTPSSNVWQPVAVAPDFHSAIYRRRLLVTVARAAVTFKHTHPPRTRKLDLIKSTAKPTTNPPPWHVRPGHRRRLRRPIFRRCISSSHRLSSLAFPDSCPVKLLGSGLNLDDTPPRHLPGFPALQPTTYNRSPSVLLQVLRNLLHRPIAFARLSPRPRPPPLTSPPQPSCFDAPTPSAPLSVVATALRLSRVFPG
ncbi:hypothetical protein FDECE_12864 [Fusarium decemcellulare]|nr:hypothetical protein FDECE_12864 [Fusarium decemcellulare]